MTEQRVDRQSARHGYLRAAGLLVVAAIAVFAGTGCEKSKPDPEETLRTFLADLRSGRGDAAWAALSTESQHELKERHEAIARAAGRPIDPKPSRMLFDELGLNILNQPESIAIVSPPGREILLRVTIKDGKSADIRMIRDGPGWKVDLMRSLEKAPPLEAALGREKKEQTDTSTTP